MGKSRIFDEFNTQIMQYIVQIEDSDPVAQSIVRLLKELARDYEFVTVLPTDSNVDENIVNELQSRYEFVRENSEAGDSWEEVKKRLLSK